MTAEQDAASNGAPGSRRGLDWKLQGLLWGLLMFAAMLLFRIWGGDPITASTLLVSAAIWSVGGLTFGLAMRWWGKRHAR